MKRRFLVTLIGLSGLAAVLIAPASSASAATTGGQHTGVADTPGTAATIAQSD